ncbi:MULTISPECIES: hemolysin XhlA family protein [Cytobacillus]|nr:MULTISPECIES: hemolysin XhlA family protein [Cytobacillus]
MNDQDKELKKMESRVFNLETRVNNLERTTDKHDHQIFSINEKLNKIDENTTWIKRTITGAIITAMCTGIIGGSIAIIFTVFKGES